MKNDAPKKFNNYIRYSGLAFQMAATILICVLIGRAIDERRGSEKQVFTAIFSVLGVMASIWNIIRSVKKSDE